MRRRGARALDSYDVPRPRRRRPSRYGSRLLRRILIGLAIPIVLCILLYGLYKSGVLGRLLLGSPVSISQEALIVRTREMGSVVTFEKQEQGTVSQKYALYYDVTLPYDYIVQMGVDLEQAQIDAASPDRVVVYLPDARIISESMTWGEKRFSGLSLGSSLFTAAREQTLKEEKTLETRERLMGEAADEQGRTPPERAWDKAAQIVIDFIRQFVRDESVEVLALPLSQKDQKDAAPAK